MPSTAHRMRSTVSTGGSPGGIPDRRGVDAPSRAGDGRVARVRILAARSRRAGCGVRARRCGASVRAAFARTHHVAVLEASTGATRAPVRLDVSRARRRRGRTAPDRGQPRHRSSTLSASLDLAREARRRGAEARDPATAAASGPRRRRASRVRVPAHRSCFPLPTRVRAERGSSTGAPVRPRRSARRARRQPRLFVGSRRYESSASRTGSFAAVGEQSVAAARRTSQSRSSSALTRASRASSPPHSASWRTAASPRRASSRPGAAHEPVHLADRIERSGQGSGRRVGYPLRARRRTSTPRWPEASDRGPGDLADRPP